MVLPSNYYDPLTGWLNSRKRGCASELAGMVLISSFGPIKHLVDPVHLSADINALFRLAKRAPEMKGLHPRSALDERESLRDLIGSALDAICEDLTTSGVDASPYNGLGVISGDEIFSCSIVVNNPMQLAEVLGVEGCLGAPWV